MAEPIKNENNQNIHFDVTLTQSELSNLLEIYMYHLTNQNPELIHKSVSEFFNELIHMFIVLEHKRIRKEVAAGSNKSSRKEDFKNAVKRNDNAVQNANTANNKVENDKDKTPEQNTPKEPDPKPVSAPVNDAKTDNGEYEGMSDKDIDGNPEDLDDYVNPEDLNDDIDRDDDDDDIQEPMNDRSINDGDTDFIEFSDSM